MRQTSGFSARDDATRRAVRLIAVLGAALIGLTAAAIATADQYDFIYVDAFQGNYTLRECFLFDINDRGEGCGHATDLPSYSGFYWTQAADKTRIPFTYARGINSAGRIAGLNRVFDLMSGQLTTIPLVPGAPAPPVALDINDRDVVVGYAETCICSNSERVLQIPFAWDPLSGVRSIPVPGAKDLVQINNANVAVGNIRGSARDGFVHDLTTGETTRLGALLPPAQYPWTEAADINDLGVVTGRHRSNDALSFHGYIWSAAAGPTLLPHLNGSMVLDVQPWAINNAGVVVGMAEVAEHVLHAFVWDAENGIRDLNDLVTPPPNFILDRAFGINNRGWIVGDGHFGPNWSTSQAFVLIPHNSILDAPEPVRAGELRVRPNPTRGAAAIEYAMPAAGTARIGVFDITGRRVAELVEHDRPAGPQLAQWDGRDASGRALAPGAYLVRIELPGVTLTRTIAVIR